MALIVEDRIAETSTSTGTGDFTLAGSITGFRAFSAVCATSDTLYYLIEAIDANGVPTGEWETGLGTYSAANTLTRTTVKASSNAGAAVSFAAGTKRVALAMIATTDLGVMHVQERQAVGTNGGNSTAGVWQTRTLNTVVLNTIAGASLASNQITLPAGTYDLLATSPVFRANQHQAKVYNVTGAADLCLGSSEYADNGVDGSGTSSTIRQRFTLASATVLEIRHQVQAGKTIDGLGVNNGWGTNIYTDVFIRRVL